MNTAVSIFYLLLALYFLIVVLQDIGYRIDSLNHRFGLWGYYKKRKIFETNAEEIFGDMFLFARDNKDIRLYSSCLLNYPYDEIEKRALAFGKIHFPELRAYIFHSEKELMIYYRKALAIKSLPKKN